jgi:hypothetical protein
MEDESTMDRRRFLQSSIAASAIAGASSSSSGGPVGSGNTAPAAGAVGGSNSPAKPDASAQEYYELRLYHLRRGPKQKLIQDYHRDVLIPTLNRYEIGPVGVFEPYIGPDSPTVYLLIPYKTIESFAGLGSRLAADGEYKKAGASFLNLPASDPA